MLNEVEYVDLRNALQIDPNALDEQLVNIAMQQMSAAEYTALAATQKTQAEFGYSQTIADVSANLRGQLGTDGKPRSEASIKSEIPLYDEVINAHTAMVDAEHEYSLWRGLSDAIRAKHSAIRTITDLIAAGYMTSTSIRLKQREEIHQYRQQQPFYQQHSGTEVR